MVFPPSVEGFVGADEEALFWGGGFRERIANVGAKNEEIFSCCDCVEQM
jgi:hypothetical protein